MTLGVTAALRRTLDGFGFAETRPLWPGMNDDPIERPHRKVMWTCDCGQEIWADREVNVAAQCPRCATPFKRPVADDTWPAAEQGPSAPVSSVAMVAQPCVFVAAGA